MKTKLSFEPMIFKPYQTCTPRDDLHRLYLISERVGSEKQRIQRHVGQVEPGYVDFRPYQMCTQRDSLQKLISAFERVVSKKQRIQRHVGGLSRLLTSGARRRGHAKGEEILPKIYSRSRKMILQPLVFRSYQTCTQRASLQSVENERGKIKFGGRARNFRRARPARSCLKTLILKPYDAYSQKSTFRSFPLAYECVVGQYK